MPTEAELPRLRDIERAAGLAFADIGMRRVAEEEPLTVEELRRFLDAGCAWVAGEPSPVAYLIAEQVDGNVHIEQVSVHPEHARKRIGAALIEHVARLAAGRGVPALTLTTFTEVPWNAPYYRRCGFRVLADAEITDGLRAIRAREAEAGLDEWPRCCMRRDL